MTRTTRTTVRIKVNSDVGERGPDGLGPVTQDLDPDRGGNGRLVLRQGGLDPCHGLDA